MPLFFHPFQCIDIDELDKVLSDTVGMFAQKQLDEIMKEVDQDGSNTLDFYEVLMVSTCTKNKTSCGSSISITLCRFILYTRVCTGIAYMLII